MSKVGLLSATGDEAREAMKHKRVYALLRSSGLEPLIALHVLVDARRGNGCAMNFIRVTRNAMRTK